MTKPIEKKITVPAPPRRRVVIDHEIPQKIEKWLDHFSAMSTRVRVKRSFASGIVDFKAKLEAGLKAEFWVLHPGGGIGKERRHLADIQDWPSAEEISFVIGLDLSPLADGKPEPKDVFVFCFNDFAFGLDYYHMGTDADLRQEYWWAFVLPNVPKGVTTWRAVAREIEKRLREAEKVVPFIPTE